ncbi:sugar ABC transporter permease [Burkholderiaceae bacterium DAT-1]|nr:sugar ABC transporter permease [Burkholderiaceae bacterium DAT-1]
MAVQQFRAGPPERIARQHQRYGMLMVLPLVLGLSIFFVLPLLQSVFYSFTDLGAFGAWQHLTLDNYVRLWSDEKLRAALWNTCVYAVVCVPLILAISLGLALALNANVKGIGVYRTLLFVPAVTMSTAVALVWRWIFDFDFGLLNQLLEQFQVDPQAWLADPQVVRISIMAVLVWSSIAVKMVILLAGLQAVPGEMLEAAWMDGAGKWARFRYVILPQMVPTLFFVSVMTLIEVLQIFDLIYMLVGRNPLVEDHAQSIVYLFYKYAFEEQEKGYASAVAMVLFAITMLLTVAQLKLNRYLTRWQGQ